MDVPLLDLKAQYLKYLDRPLPMHLQNRYRDLGYRKGSFPLSEKAAEEVLSFPIYAYLTEDQQSYVVHTIGQFFRRV